MRMVFGLVLVVGLGLAGFAVYMAQGYINQTQAQLQRERAAREHAVPTVRVFVAKKPLKYGEKLKPEDVVAISWPKPALPKTVFTELKGKGPRALFPNDLPGELRSVLTPIAQYEPITISNVTKPGRDAGITSRLTKGMRAFTIKVDVATGVSGFVHPGDRVDVYWTGRDNNRGDLTRLIEAGVKVIAVDQTADTASKTSTIIARTVTVEATQKQVAVLAQAQATGRLALSLVGNRESSMNGHVEADASSILGQQPVAPQAKPKPKVCTITQRSGSKVIQVPIPCTN